MIRKDYKYAVIGVSRDKNKYGYKVFADLKRAGYSVVPINPRAKEILGEQVFASLKDVPGKIDVVVMVVPPSVVEKVLPSVLSLGIDKIWLQPGSEDKKVINFCHEHQIECIHDACIMIDRQKR